MSDATSLSARSTPAVLGGAGLTDEELDREVQRLAMENSALEAQYASAMVTHHQLVERVVNLQQAAEMEEEAISNNLLKKVDQVKKEMRSHRQHIKQEEEYHEVLKRQIEGVRSEQVKMENMMEQEQEFLLHKLQRELIETTLRKSVIEKALAEERRQYLELLHHQLTALMASSANPTSTPVNALAAASSSTTGGGATKPLHARTLSDTGVSMDASFSDTTTQLNASVGGSGSVAAGAAASLTNAAAGCGRSLHLGSSTTPSMLGSQTLKTPDSKRRTIAELELEINHLLLEQAEYQRKTQMQEQHCVELAGKLQDIQQRSFLDRARIARLKEDLTKAKSDLELVQRSVSHSSLMAQLRSTPSQSSEDPAGSSGTTPLHHLSLRDRTKEVLSTPRFEPDKLRLRGSSVASDHRSVSPSVGSGYNSGADATTASSFRDASSFGNKALGSTPSSATQRHHVHRHHHHHHHSAQLADALLMPVGASASGGAMRPRNWSVASSSSNSLVAPYDPAREHHQVPASQAVAHRATTDASPLAGEQGALTDDERVFDGSTAAHEAGSPRSSVTGVSEGGQLGSDDPSQ